MRVDKVQVLLLLHCGTLASMRNLSFAGKGKQENVLPYRAEKHVTSTKQPKVKDKGWQKGSVPSASPFIFHKAP